MNIKKSENMENDIFIECPYCRVSSIKLSAEEYALVEAGQQMVEVCQVCGREVKVHECI